LARRAAQGKTDGFTDFLILLGVCVVVSLLTMATVHFTIDGLIAQQDSRNRFLQKETAVLDKKIKEIKELEKTKSKLLARMEVIQRLLK